MRRIILLLLLIFFGSACISIVDNSDTNPQEQAAMDSVGSEPHLDSIDPECLNSEMKVMGENISKQFGFVSEEQIMTWFCDGSEFEDILVALQTEKVTSHSAQELLEMLVNGLTWDEIWQSIGFLEE